MKRYSRVDVSFSGVEPPSAPGLFLFEGASKLPQSKTGNTHTPPPPGGDHFDTSTHCLSPVHPYTVHCNYSIESNGLLVVLVES
jgi:hypothetical protein